MSNAKIKSLSQQLAAGFQQRFIAKIMPKAEGNSGQFQAAAAAATVLHRRIAFRVRLPGHYCHPYG
ncbi:Uncharacterised protein [Cedecea neteri]|uniref:Uncharacterized protein n=1 Tax=Cedecea neteri TaxID=158822 RepID=A0A2X3JAJ3_9ENTR|nr:Uncharacterised protein [Cedecea neteri]